MTIQWFPGHMAKAKREMIEKMKLIDVVIEIVDARVPWSSRNPMIDEIVQHKPRLLLLNKADLADPAVTEQWVRFFKEKHSIPTIPINATQSKSILDIYSQIDKLWADKKESWTLKGVQKKEARILIVGIPNVGKSTLINQLAGKKATITGDRPGVTKGQQWIKVKGNLLLLDSPGILWPKFEDPIVGKNLAIIGTIKDDLLFHGELVLFVTQYLIAHYRHVLQAHFTNENIPQNVEPVEEIITFIENIGRKKGALIRGGQVDVEKTSLLILKDLRAGKWGKFSFEKPD
jgi:ribosome biogenesis GTPase A